MKKSDLKVEEKGQKVTVEWKLTPGTEFGYVAKAGFAGVEWVGHLRRC